jgi:putative endonuclease
MLRRLLDTFRRRRHGIPDSRTLGRKGESRACRHLKQLGYRILARNARLHIGEADIVAESPDRRDIVICEVKTRLRGSGRSVQGDSIAPEASVHARKRSKLGAIARSLSRANGWQNRPVRIDVIAIDWPADGSEPQLRHHVGIATRR